MKLYMIGLLLASTSLWSMQQDRVILAGEVAKIDRAIGAYLAYGRQDYSIARIDPAARALLDLKTFKAYTSKRRKKLQHHDEDSIACVEALYRTAADQKITVGVFGLLMAISSGALLAAVVVTQEHQVSRITIVECAAVPAMLACGSTYILMQGADYHHVANKLAAYREALK